VVVSRYGPVRIEDNRLTVDDEVGQLPGSHVIKLFTSVIYECS
jgi:hypothetical protein